MNWHLDVLPSVQRNVLRQLGPVAADLGFYLAGGTAVALYLGHRESLDLDWFTEEMGGEPLACYRKKFSVQDVARVVFALCYFDDAESSPMPKMLTETTWEEAKRSLRQSVKSTAL
ncbi:MAG: hypothetical protein KJ000_23400 [Pirellulaceae bacterium]|nr:hypothetical protein [Pirellulaceae bacterium]